jgi:hypothetical protein
MHEINANDTFLSIMKVIKEKFSLNMLGAEMKCLNKILPLLTPEWKKF